MKRKQLSLAIHGVLAVSLLAVIPAHAQDASTDGGSEQKATTLQAVTVTARKREETLQDVPVAVTAFTADALDKLNVEDLSDLDGQVPNLTIYAARGSSSTLTAYIRGVGQSDPLWGVDPGVGIYMDDVYIARPQGALLDVFDVERIEVLRGPQGTLYGKNTIGGAIKYISRGLRSDFNGFGSVTVGNYGQRDVKAAVGGGFAGSEYLRGRISFADLHRDGFGENLITGAQVSDKKIRAYRMNLGAYVTDAVDLQFSLDHVDDSSGVRGAQMFRANPFDALFTPTTGPFLPLESRYDVRNGMPNVNDTTLSGASATVNVRASNDWTFKYVLAKRESDTETNIDFDTTPDKIADVKAFYSDEQVTHELQANYDAGGRSRGVVGLYKFDGEAGGQVLNNFFNLAFGDTQGVVYTESVAAYADWTFDVSDRFSVDVGARWTDEDKHAVVRNIGYTDATFTRPSGTVAASFDKTINFTNLSPKISMDYQVTPNVMVYGLATRGFKSGGYNIRAQATAVPRSAEPFQDEQVDSYEVGTKMGLLEDRLFLNLSAFHNRYKDIQLSIFTEYTTPQNTKAFFGDFTNAGEGTVEGFEAEYQWLATDNFTVSGNLAWLDAKYDTYLFKGFNIADQQEFTNAPDFSGALNLEYRTDLGAAGSLSARVGYTYQSRVVATTEVVFDPVTKATVQPISQEGYGLVGAGVIWKPADAWTVSLQGSNLADKAYRTTGYNLFAALGVHTGFYGPPRQYSLSLKYDF
ncbi:MAG: TonB-dependent receptor [Pseudomonadota bacterium]